ncbi:response regulator transcription factor [Nocardia sp. NPDC058058]|uniref:response regulator transcription factor n=1 Tax=Nocardia sp. NPDC058058 TaxID=3346317 RepID=UPI0036DA3CEE
MIADRGESLAVTTPNPKPPTAERGSARPDVDPAGSAHDSGRPALESSGAVRRSGGAVLEPAHAPLESSGAARGPGGAVLEPVGEVAAANCVLIGSADRALRVELERGLRLAGYAVRAVPDVRSVARGVERPPDALVLDAELPGGGADLVTALRAAGSVLPICVVGARTSLRDRVIALNSGADDYLMKPFAMAELVARLGALLRRSQSLPRAPRTRTVVGPLLLDRTGRLVTVYGREVRLTRREFDLLDQLAGAAGEVQTRRALLRQVWGFDFATDTNTIDVVLGSLRRKLAAADAPKLIHTVRGIGYVLREPC